MENLQHLPTVKPNRRSQNPMVSTRDPVRLAALLAALACFTEARAQTSANPPSPSAAEVTAPATTAEQRAEAVKLDPFEVRADSDNSYGALNSNSITRFNTELNKMPLSADVFDRAFIDDVGATSRSSR